jgi:short subunit dehydrogenase-like uncharacterized protein
MRVVVYGATGFTGRLVARALRARGIAFVAAGRDAARLRELADELGGVETRVAPLGEPELLYPALADADLVIGCAGPFARFGEPVVRAALRAGAHYLDTTGEQQFMRDTYERYEAEARHRQLCVVNAFAFEVALGDWAAALAADALGAAHAANEPAEPRGAELGAPLDEVAIGYALSDFHPTRGTQLSALEAIAGEGYVWERDRWDPAPAMADTRSVGFPPPIGPKAAISFPAGEIISVPRHVHTRRVRCYLAVGTPALRALGPAARALGPLLGAAVRSPLGRALRRRVESGPPGPTDGQRKVADFAVVAEARRGFDTAFCAVTGTDVYGVTAEIIAYGVELVRDRPPRATGVLAPAELADPAEALRTLGERCGLRVTASFTC